MVTLELSSDFQPKEGEAVTLCIDAIETSGEDLHIKATELGLPVPVEGALRETLVKAYKAIRYNFHARERLGNIIHSIRENHGDDPKTTWGALIEELQELLDRLQEAAGLMDIEPMRSPLYKEDFQELCSISTPKLSCNLMLHPEPVWVEYSPNTDGGMLILRCSGCDVAFMQIPVASKKFAIVSRE